MKQKDYLIIDRSKWRTGAYGEIYKTGKGVTSLLNRNGYMCCLGFRCHQMGIPKKDLLNCTTPSGLSNDWDIPDLLDKHFNSDFTTIAMDINDSLNLNIKEREKRIKKHFTTIGITVEFKGKY
jgi:hypothetical protein